MLLPIGQRPYALRAVPVYASEPFLFRQIYLEMSTESVSLSVVSKWLYLQS